MTRPGDPAVSGLAVIDKPPGWTSHDVVARTRKLLGTRKVGHSGTLDPDATGVLLVGVGGVTRLLRFLTALPKRYVGEMVLGVETSTLDASGEVTATHDMRDVTLADVRGVLAAFTGPITQIPPMVSAVKIGGRRLHELARAGEVVERRPRAVTVHEIAAAPTDDPAVFRLEVACSSGTYVRALAADIGAALGGGAHLRALRRTAIGSFTIAEATALDAVTRDVLLPPAEALRDYPRVVADAAAADAVAHGKVLDREVLGVEGEGPWAVLSGSGTLHAVYESFGARVKPAVVLPAEGR